MPMLALIALALQAAAPPPPSYGPPLPPRTPRARGPALDASVEAAQAAVRACLANGYKVTALIVDSEGVPVVMLAADGAFYGTQIIARTKVDTVLQYRVASGVIAERVKTDAALDAEVKANPKIGNVRRGGLPILVDGQLIGAFAVSGAPGGEKDEACVVAGMAAVGGRLR